MQIATSALHCVPQQTLHEFDLAAARETLPISSSAANAGEQDASIFEGAASILGSTASVFDSILGAVGLSGAGKEEASEEGREEEAKK
eukprot:2632050-Rhodomonas_salina.3